MSAIHNSVLRLIIAAIFCDHSSGRLTIAAIVCDLSSDEELDLFMVVQALCNCKNTRVHGDKKVSDYKLVVIATSTLIGISLYLYCRLASNSTFSTFVFPIFSLCLDIHLSAAGVKGKAAICSASLPIFCFLFLEALLCFSTPFSFYSVSTAIVERVQFG